MGLVKILAVLGLASASSFSIAQTIVVPGNNNSPYQPPPWIVRLATKDAEFPVPIDSFIIKERDGTRVISKISGIKYPCLREVEVGVMKWQFCDMR